MNVVIDLAARAVSFITLIQDTVLKGALTEADKRVRVEDVFCLKFSSDFPACINSSPSNIVSFRQKAIDLVWVSIKSPHESKAVEYATHLCIALAGWIYDHRTFLFARVKSCGSFPAPYSWRQAITELLYKDEDKNECLQLAIALQYLPMQVVLAVGGTALNAHGQRVLQSWRMDRKVQDSMLTTSERETADKYYEIIEAEAPELLKKETHLLEVLKQQNAPLSFDLTFYQELDEIADSRGNRWQEQCLTKGVPVPKEEKPDHKSPDPFIQATKMKLSALALSGGGIRSATLNLGILQALAKRGAIGKFDYLSTVSGGGYIGSWLAAWIKRDGSVTKVSDRLDPDKSPDPFGEEVRPIRWLRMFSNYFAPNASIMSADAWTVGATWLRNTLLNQLIILLMFLGLLLFINILYATWGSTDLFYAEINPTHVFVWSLLLILPVALLAGIGMQSYHREKFPPAAFNNEKKSVAQSGYHSYAFCGSLPGKCLVVCP